MEELCRISVSDTPLEEEFFEKNLPEDKQLLDEYHNSQSLLKNGEILLEEPQQFNHDSDTFTKTEHAVETSAQAFSHNIIKKENFSDEFDTQVSVKQEIIEEESKYAYTPSDIIIPVKEELSPSSSDTGLIRDHVVIKDELNLMDIDQEILVNKSRTSDVSSVTGEKSIGETIYKMQAETEFDTLAHLNTSEESTGHNFECEVCHKIFTHTKKLLIHKIIHSCYQKYQCDECSQIFITSSYLSKHKLTHTGIRIYQCNTCSKTFTQSSHLSTHKLSHIGIRKYQCSVCNKAFTTSSNLSQHKLTHSGIRKYHCGECSKTFISSSYLSKHKLTHTGIRIYQCDECGKTFTWSSSLSKHKLTHTGIRIYQCDECGKTFTHSSGLSRHKLTHSGITKYQCDECSKSFTTSSNLSTHKLTHSGIRKYQCSVCNKTFIHSSHLKTHLLIHTCN